MAGSFTCHDLFNIIINIKIKHYKMKRIVLFFLAACIALPLFSQGRGLNIPNLKGYVTLKCDFHVHTVFSDGAVWPTVRIDEAYRDGLDVIAISDHIEYRPNVVDSHNRSYEIALPYAKARGIILIKGSEISREMPPGHSNAIFITDADKLDTPDYMDAFRAAKAQNAFIFWNHPDFQQADSTRWWPEHTKLLEQGFMYGIEVVNYWYIPEAHRWCLEHNLTMLGNTDSHTPIPPFAPGKYRAMTLVFASSATPEGIREALDNRRTAVYHNDYVIGEEKYLRELFETSLEWKVEKTNKEEEMRVTVKNNSGLTFRLKSAAHDPRVIYIRRHTSVVPYVIAPNSTQSFEVRLLDGIREGDVNFIVENFFVEPDKGMSYTITVK